MSNKHNTKTHILVLDKDDPDRELDFEIEFQLSLTPRQRYKIMGQLFRQRLRWAKQHDSEKIASITARV
jgi:hypothetical protein